MDELNDAFARAAQIANKLPKNLQEVGFNRALDQLLAAKTGGASAPSRSQAHRTSNVHSASAIDPHAVATSALLNAIDRTKYSDIGATTRVADRALKILQLAHNDHDVDGLTAAQVSEILTQKFRLAATTGAVRMALQRETGTVDETSGVFRIMAPGDTYLERLRAGEPGGGTARGAVSRHRKTTSRKKERSTAQTTKAPAPPSKESGSGHKPQRKGSSRPGPKAAITYLIGKGFFTTPRTITEIQETLKHDRGNAYSVHELSPALVRCVRDESLTRERNDAGQYEYSVGT